MGFALCLRVRTCVASEDLVIHTTWGVCYEQQTFTNLREFDLPSCKGAAVTLMNSSFSVNGLLFVTWISKPGCGLNFLCSWCLLTVLSDVNFNLQGAPTALV